MNVKVNGVDFDDIEAAFRSGRRVGKSGMGFADTGVEVVVPQACRRCGATPPKLSPDFVHCESCARRRAQGTRSPSRRVVAVKRSRDARGAA